MKLKSAYLKAFGKFIDAKITFGPTINLISGNNESGKSTLAEFIFNMLYGQKKYGVKRRIYTNSHNYNKPWDHTLYQGTLQYSLNEEDFRVERNFHDDFEETKIYIESTGKEITDSFKYDARKELQFFDEQIGLSERIFKNSIYVPQNDMEAQLNKKNENVLEEILGKTIYAVEGEQGEKTIREAINQLEKRKKEIGTPNNKNKILGSNYEKLRKEIRTKYELEYKMKLNSDYQQSLREVINKLDKINEEKRKLEIQIKILDNKSIEKKIHIIENYMNQKQDLIVYITENFADNIKESSIEVINNQRKENKIKIKRLLVNVIVMFFIYIIIAIWIGISPKFSLQIPILGISIILNISYIFKMRYAYKNEECLFNMLEKVNQYQDAVYELKHLQEKIDDETREYTIEQLKNKIYHIEVENIVISNKNKYEVEIELKKLEKEKFDLITEKTSYEIRIQENNWDPFKLEQIERDINNLKKTIEDYEENIQAIDIAISTLNTIEKHGKSKWLPDIIKKTEENIYKITKKYHTIKIDEKYQIKTLEPKSQKLIPIEQLSKGTFNQFYFALRISMIQAFSPLPIKLTIILDEPFINFDNNRFMESMNLLKEISKRHQIIIFSSQTREKKYLDDYNCDYNYIEL
jgi:uncharacterized protein YhaN